MLQYLTSLSFVRSHALFCSWRTQEMERSVCVAAIASSRWWHTWATWMCHLYGASDRAAEDFFCCWHLCARQIFVCQNFSTAWAPVRSARGSHCWAPLCGQGLGYKIFKYRIKPFSVEEIRDLAPTGCWSSESRFTPTPCQEDLESGGEPSRGAQCSSQSTPVKRPSSTTSDGTPSPKAPKRYMDMWMNLLFCAYQVLHAAVLLFGRYCEAPVPDCHDSSHVLAECRTIIFQTIQSDLKAALQAADAFGISLDVTHLHEQTTYGLLPKRYSKQKRINSAFECRWHVLHFLLVAGFPQGLRKFLIVQLGRCQKPESRWFWQTRGKIVRKLRASLYASSAIPCPRACRCPLWLSTLLLSELLCSGSYFSFVFFTFLRQLSLIFFQLQSAPRKRHWWVVKYGQTL